jgi:hypothetical protein
MAERFSAEQERILWRLEDVQESTFTNWLGEIELAEFNPLPEEDGHPVSVREVL